ncbi:MAG TPA: molybdopterin dinucleotide binding domain-containing protein, partial [Myxococcales bacterium]|nr:molybdopterin dinucleotide binding domain-containing protein [Myxococcales bacterium]
LRIHPDDAAALGVASGGLVRLVTRKGEQTVPVEISASMQRGHVALPNGLGVAYGGHVTGAPPNELTSTEDRDPFVGTPWHKNVPARLERA